MPNANATALQWLATGNNLARLEKLCEKMGAATGEDADELYGRAIDKLIEHGETWIAKHDTTKQTSLDSWVLVCVGYSIRTRADSKNIILTKLQSLEDQMPESLLYRIEGSTDTRSSDAQEPNSSFSIHSALADLCEYDRWLIVSRHVHKVNFTTIAEAVGVSKGTIRTHYLRAIERVRSNNANKSAENH